MPANTVTIRWKRFCSYQEALDHEKAEKKGEAVYVHQLDDKKTYYVGKLGKSWFGKRFARGYRHWLDGCLMHGDNFFIGRPNTSVLNKIDIDDVERTLIKRLCPKGNRLKVAPRRELKLDHSGDIPAELKDA